ncbi:MAG: helix-turn-helix domain-containing protein [Clostridiales bacterium]|nr:helix-turn-helix domain-containing protein [Clostridiales bacterium]
MEGQQNKTSMSVMEMGRLLGLKKTDSYWLIKKGYFKTIQAAGVMRVMIDSFEDWYDHQFTYRKVDGTKPGQALKDELMTVSDIMEVLNISRKSVEWVIHRYHLETRMVYGKRCVERSSFDRWYLSQPRYVSNADAEKKKLMALSFSMPEVARLLGVTRNAVYYLVAADVFEIIYVGKQKRITKASFEKWYGSQNRYKLADCQPEQIAERSEENGLDH